MEKQAAIIPKLVRLGATPIKGTPQLFMKSRTPAELGALQGKVEGAIHKGVTGPLESALKGLRVNKGIGYGANALAAASERSPVIPGAVGRALDKYVPSKLRIPQFQDAAQRRQWAMQKGDQAVRTIAENPAAALLPGGLALPVVDRLLGRMMPKTASLVDSMFKLAELTIERVQERRGMVKEAQVAPYQQKTQWSCSAACLKAVLENYGITISEEECVGAIGAREGRGAEVTDISEGARRLGYDSFDYLFHSLDQAKVLTDQGIPIICDIRSFNYDGKGHYVVLTDIDDAGVRLMDPNTPGNQRLLTHDHMDARWWDYTMAKPRELREKWGVVVLPPETSDAP